MNLSPGKLMSLAIGMAELLSMLTAELDDLPDERKASNNTRYTVEEAMKSAFSVFFMQSRSFLAAILILRFHDIKMMPREG